MAKEIFKSFIIMCVIRRIIAYLCLNMIHFNAVDFSELRSEEVQWRHQDLKSWGARRGQRLIMGGKHVRVAHIASAKREPIFLNCWGPIFFWANMCAERT